MSASKLYKTIYDLVELIPQGKVTSYGALAQAVGSTARVVGWAMNACHRLEPPIPAHRVVNAQGKLTGANFFETPSQMQELLEAEGLVIKNLKIVNFKAHFWHPFDEL